MTEESARERVAILRAELEAANYRYYVLDDPVLTDREFDMYMQELKRLEAQFPSLMTPESPSQRVGFER